MITQQTATHTPGPWTLAGSVITGTDVNNYQAPICTLANSWRDRRIDEANAHLMAAAPEMFMALTHAERALLVPTDYELTLEALADIHAALALAMKGT